jgi:predicted ester cyclase
MSIQENKELIRRYLEALSGKPKPDNVIDLFVADPQLKEHILASEAAFPLYRMDAEEVVAEGDLVAVRARVSGVQQGAFNGMPPSGRGIDVPLCITYRVAGGKIVDHWMVWDSMVMLQQLGLMPEPAAT